MEFFEIESKIKTLDLSEDSRNTDFNVTSLDCYGFVDAVKCKDKAVLERLQQERLNQVLHQLQKERLDETFSRTCLFCKKHFLGNRLLLFNHLIEQHNFHIGAPDNIVFANELFDVLEEMLKNLKCFYCEKTFKDWLTLKEHMRKKQHKSLNPKNKTYDRFYIINYLELGKSWTEVQAEDDSYLQEESDSKEELMECEAESLQYKCLFCNSNFPSFDETLHHMKIDHLFDFRNLVQQNHLDFYKQVKLINYIRRQVFEKTCIFCDWKYDFIDDLMKHMMETGHISLFPDQQRWDNAMFYFSSFENDNLLCSLDVDEYSDNQDMPLIFPEDTDVIKSTILLSEDFRRSLS